MRWPWIGVLAIGFGVGCHRAEPVVLPSVAPSSYAPVEKSPAFSALEDAAQSAESAAGNLAQRTSFTPSQRDALRKNLAGAVAKAVQATSSPVTFAYVPRKPFEKAPNQLGWRMIGRVLRWELLAALEESNYDRAVTLAVQSARLGFSLTGGGASDASLGFAIAEDGRQAILGSLSELPPEALNRLADGLEKAIADKPSLQTTIEHEGQSSLLAVQFVQDAYTNHQLEVLNKELGPSVKEAVEKLQELSVEKAGTYFQAFAGEAHKGTDTLKQWAALPTVRRSEVPKFRSEKRKPLFWRFSTHFVGVAEPLLGVNDRVEARFRILALTCRLMAKKKSEGKVPKSLRGIDDGVNTDPFTGEPLQYRSDGSDFLVYSVGADGKDDGGDTDDTFEAPDLTIEG